ncbi:hypothetical protein F5146DRAFT_1140634 [Armillaria mellea]|nr:hypothetical protein F5146DRAFT_1140634 [Armillaria mellea]
MTTLNEWTILSSNDVDQQTDALLGRLTQDIYALDTSRDVPRPVVSALNLARAVMGQLKPDIRDNALLCVNGKTRVRKLDSLVDAIHSPLFERALSIIACIHVEVESPTQMSLPIQIKKGMGDYDSSRNPHTVIFTYPGGVGMAIVVPLKSARLCYLFHATRSGHCTCAISNNPGAQAVWFEQFRSGPPFVAYVLQHRPCSREDFRTKDADAETQRLLGVSLDILDSERELERWRAVHEGYCRLDHPGACVRCRRLFLGPAPSDRNRPLPEVPGSACSSGTGETCVRTPAPTNMVFVVRREKMARVKVWRKKTFEVEEERHELDPGSESD